VLHDKTWFLIVTPSPVEKLFPPTCKVMDCMHVASKQELAKDRFCRAKGTRSWRPYCNRPTCCRTCSYMRSCPKMPRQRRHRVARKWSTKFPDSILAVK